MNEVIFTEADGKTKKQMVPAKEIFNTIVFAQHLSHTNDVSGNPRRLWVGYNNQGYIVSVVNENYGGFPAYYWGRSRSCFKELAPHRITAAEYKETIRMAQRTAVYYVQ